MSKRTTFSIVGVFLLLLVGWIYRSTSTDKVSDGSRASRGRGGSMGGGAPVLVVAGKVEQAARF